MPSLSTPKQQRKQQGNESSSKARFPSFGRRRGRTDESIIRGAAIIRDHIANLNSNNGYGRPSNARTSSGTLPTHQNSPSLGVDHSSDEEDETRFSDPWLAKVTPTDSSVSKQFTPRALTPDTKPDDSSSFVFGSTFSGSIGSSSQLDWANRALAASRRGEDSGSAIFSVRTPQPDTDPCEPLSPPRSAKKTQTPVGRARTAPYMMAPMLSANEEIEDNGYDFVDRDYEDDLDDYDEVCGRPGYLSKDMPIGLGQRVGSNRRKNENFDVGGNRRKSRILQLVTNQLGAAAETNVPPKAAPQPPSYLQQQHRSSALDNVVSPLSVEYTMLLQDPAYLHARSAGHLWQSLVGSQIRFPSSWWNGARSPPMGHDSSQHRPWQFYGRYSSRNPNLRRYVKHRSAPGRLLLHIVVQDLVTWKPVQDIAVGCIDPNSRGIRKTSQVTPGMEDYRELWLAVRKRSDSISVIDSLLARGRSWHEKECKGPLGPDQRVTNSNVRAIFGDKPPLETVFVHESTLYERLVAGKAHGPALFLVQEFVFC